MVELNLTMPLKGKLILLLSFCVVPGCARGNSRPYMTVEQVAAAFKAKSALKNVTDRGVETFQECDREPLQF